MFDKVCKAISLLNSYIETLDDEDGVLQISEFLNTLKENNISVDNFAEDGQYPLIMAIESGWDAVVGLLLENGADVNKEVRIYNQDIVYPLFVALSCGCSTDIVELLLLRGADVNNLVLHGFTPLSFAVMIESVDKAKILLEFGADFSVKYDGRSLVEISNSIRNPDLIKLIESL